MHTQEGLATMLTSIFDLTARCLLQHDMLGDDQLLHAVPARRWPFGIICGDQATALMRTLLEVWWLFLQLP